MHASTVIWVVSLLLVLLAVVGRVLTHVMLDRLSKVLNVRSVVANLVLSLLDVTSYLFLHVLLSVVVRYVYKSRVVRAVRNVPIVSLLDTSLSVKHVPACSLARSGGVLIPQHTTMRLSLILLTVFAHLDC